MGERASAQMVRDGEDSLVVSGRFFVRESAGEGAGEGADADSAWEDAPAGRGAVRADASSAGARDGGTAEAAPCERDLVVTRRVGADGRSRVTLDGRMASAAQLAATIGPVMDLCGQHEHQRLLKPANHVTFLDAWAKDQVEAPLRAY